MDNAELLNTTEAANYLGVSKAYLERDRWKGATLPFVRIGGRTIRYRKSDLDAFINASIRPYGRKDLFSGEDTDV